MHPVIETSTLTVTLSDGARRFRLDASGLAVRAGEAVALTGSSGTGKTLLLEVIGLMRRPDPGASGFRLKLPGAAAADIGATWASAPARIHALRGSAYGFIPQHGGLLPFLSLGENIALSQQIAGRPDATLILTLANRLGISDLLSLRPDRLSIGQRQRGTIAAALAHRPAVVIADEPTAALDPGNAAEALGLILDAARAEGAAVLLSSHDVDLLDGFALTRQHLAIAPAPGPGLVLSRLGSPPAEPADAAPVAEPSGAAP